MTGLINRFTFQEAKYSGYESHTVHSEELSPPSSVNFLLSSNKTKGGVHTSRQLVQSLLKDPKFVLIPLQKHPCTSPNDSTTVWISPSTGVTLFHIMYLYDCSINCFLRLHFEHRQTLTLCIGTRLRYPNTLVETTQG